MINILKLFEELVIALSRDKFFLATVKLTIFYVLSSAVILFVTSTTILLVFSPSETVSILPDKVDSAEVEFNEWNIYEVREHLPAVVALVDVMVLFIVSIFSYYFAQRTLLPIKNMHELQTRFMGDVAHELRTPLSVMQAGADLVLKKPRLIEEYQEFAHDIQEETRRLTRLSNQLLQLLKIGDVIKTEIREVDISDISETELRRFAAYGQAQGVTLVDNISSAVRLHTESDAFVQILQNILKNAIDYNHSGGLVTVTLSEKDSVVYLEITDTGVGISPEAQAVIFNRFVKGDSARTQTTESGAGLGLSIVKGLVVRLNGQLELNSTPKVGTTIKITLPKKSS